MTNATGWALLFLAVCTAAALLIALPVYLNADAIGRSGISPLTCTCTCDGETAELHVETDKELTNER